MSDQGLVVPVESVDRDHHEGPGIHATELQTHSQSRGKPLNGF